MVLGLVGMLLQLGQPLRIGQDGGIHIAEASEAAGRRAQPTAMTLTCGTVMGGLPGPSEFVLMDPRISRSHTMETKVEL